MNKKSGFSLIEILVVIVLFSFLAVIVAQSTLRSFTGTRKVDAQGIVRDNLDFASSVVERNLRNARTIESICDGSARSSISYTDQEGNVGSFTCNSGSDGYLASGSAQIRVTSDKINLTSCSFTCAQPSSVNPPTIDFVFGGKVSQETQLNESFATISKRVVLRVY